MSISPPMCCSHRVTSDTNVVSTDHSVFVPISPENDVDGGEAEFGPAVSADKEHLRPAKLEQDLLRRDEDRRQYSLFRIRAPRLGGGLQRNRHPGRLSVTPAHEFDPQREDRPARVTPDIEGRSGERTPVTHRLDAAAHLCPERVPSLAKRHAWPAAERVDDHRIQRERFEFHVHLRNRRPPDGATSSSPIACQAP